MRFRKADMGTVLVSGCFDLLHAGHITFFKKAAEFGDLYVSVGSDETIKQLKGSWPLFSESERLYIIKSIGCVKDAFIGSGSGELDFYPNLLSLSPKFLIVNEDGNSPLKRKVCQELGVEYIVLSRNPEPGFPARSSSGIKRRSRAPYRVSLAGGWIDQPWVSKYCFGSMVVASLEATHEYEERSGLASSTRKKIAEIWGERLPSGSPEKLARILFANENPPGTKYVSGSQDSIGLTYPGISKLFYDGSYWPSEIESTLDPDVLDWFERVVHLVSFGPRPPGFDPLSKVKVQRDLVKKLGEAGKLCWKSILNCDVKGLGQSLKDTLRCYWGMFPASVDDAILARMTEYDDSYGYLLAGAGGGGYLMVISDQPVPNSLDIKVRRSEMNSFF